MPTGSLCRSHGRRCPCATPASSREIYAAPSKSVEVLPEGKIKRGMEIANKLGARAVLIIGEDEIASGEYSLKNMLSGEQIKVKREEMSARLGSQN